MSGQRDTWLQREAYDKQGMLTAIREQFKIDWHGIHGANHWARVLHHGIAIGTELVIQIVLAREYPKRMTKIP